MVTTAGELVVSEQQAVLFYVYCDDVAAKRSELIAANITAGPMKFPFHSPGGEFRIVDPDGYVIMMRHTDV